MKEKETTPRHREMAEDGLSKSEDVYTVPFKRKARPPQGKKPKILGAWTPQEEKVVELIAKGLSEQEISDLLSISKHTFRAHRKSSRERVGARTTAHLTAMYVLFKLSIDEK